MVAPAMSLGLHERGNHAVCTRGPGSVGEGSAVTGACREPADTRSKGQNPVRRPLESNLSHAALSQNSMNEASMQQEGGEPGRGRRICGHDKQPDAQGRHGFRERGWPMINFSCRSAVTRNR
jgi:hypothetical protein